MASSKYFSESELACKCGECAGEAKMDAAFLATLDAIREDYGKLMRITSGYRCPAHNEKVSHTGSDGPHTTGKAVDVAVGPGEDAHRLVALAIMHGINGVGVSQRDGQPRFVHMDSMDRRAVWSY